jgi:hypoxanthine phosphoribosyltransferase
MFSEEAIKDRIRELATAIEEDYRGSAPVFVGVLSGSFIFLADLCRMITLDCEIDFVRVESYGKNTTSSGKPQLTLGLKLDLAGKPVIIVDEIIDTGLTLKSLVNEISALGPSSVKTCTLVDKKAHRRVDLEADYVGFSVDDGFLVGYGLDAAERKRNLPAIHLLEE